MVIKQQKNIQIKYEMVPKDIHLLSWSTGTYSELQYKRSSLVFDALYLDSAFM